MLIHEINFFSVVLVFLFLFLESIVQESAFFQNIHILRSYILFLFTYSLVNPFVSVDYPYYDFYSYRSNKCLTELRRRNLQTRMIVFPPYLSPSMISSFFSLSFESANGRTSSMTSYHIAYLLTASIFFLLYTCSVIPLTVVYFS